MSTIFDNDILIHYIASPGLPGDGFTAPEAATIRADLDTMLERPVIDSIDDLVPGATAGQVPIKQSGGEWEPGEVGGTVAIVQEAWSDSTIVENVSSLRPLHGISVVPGTSGTAYLKLEFGGTGNADSVARSDHMHSLLIDQQFPFPASGTLSGGTRTLISDSITGLDSAKTYVIKGALYVHVRGDGTGASFVRPRVTINAVSKDIFEDARAVAGVLISESVPHGGVVVSGLSTVAVSASVSFQPGDPAYIGGGVLVIEIDSNR